MNNIEIASVNVLVNLPGTDIVYLNFDGPNPFPLMPKESCSARQDVAKGTAIEWCKQMGFKEVKVTDCITGERKTVKFD